MYDKLQPKTTFLKFHIITLDSPQTMENYESLIKHQCNALDLPSSFLPLTNAMEDLQHGILDFSRDCSLHCHVKVERVREEMNDSNDRGNSHYRERSEKTKSNNYGIVLVGMCSGHHQR